MNKPHCTKRRDCTYRRGYTTRLALPSLLFIVAALLAACGDSGNDEEQNSQFETTVEAFELPEYPFSEMQETLAWETNNSDPIFADPAAQKGGMFRSYVTLFPLTLRTVGPDSNNQIRSILSGNQLSLVGQHPETGNILPELATHWAYGADNKTVYYKLNPDARWSDGKPITADDYLFTLDFMRSPHIVAPWYNNHYSNEIDVVKKYDDHTISITGASKKPPVDLHYYYGIQPTPRHFHKLDENWVKNYNWKIAPNSGPYQITKIKRGKYLELELKDNWWARDLRYFQHRFNVKRIRIKVIRNEEIAYKYFLRGELDSYNLQLPKFWHDKAKGELYDKGYLQKTWFYNDIPRSPFGFYLNQDQDIFKDRDTRYGFAHAVNMDGMIERILRGDSQRLPAFHVGYGAYSDHGIKPRGFNLQLADKYFNKAGWTERGDDGIRVKGEQRLSAAITYGSAQHNDKLVFLKEEARKAGVELVLDQLDSASFFKKLNEKTYQIAFLGFGSGYRPAFWQHFHSDNAHITQTNNMTNTDNPVIDEKIMAFRAATEEHERIALSIELNQLVHDQGAFIPGYYAPYTRSAHWRWIKLPAFIATRESGSVVAPFGANGGLFWIDQEAKQETLSAKRAGKTFAPVTTIDTRYKAES